MTFDIDDPNLQTMVDKAYDEALENQAEEEQTNRLTVIYERLNNGAERVLSPGMLAQWKPGLRNKGYPEYGQPVVVMELLESAIFDPQETVTSPYFRDPLTLVAGLLASDGDFISFHYDIRRFEPYKGSAATCGRSKVTAIRQG